MSLSFPRGRVAALCGAASAVLLWGAVWCPAICGAQSAPTKGPFDHRIGLVVLQFDDGTIGHYTHAFRILEKYRLKGSFGVVTGRFDAPGRLTSAQVVEMHRAGHEIHDHTLIHDAAFWGNPPKRADWVKEIQQSLGILKKLGIQTRGWNQPGGKGQAWTPELRQTLAPHYDYVAGRVGLEPNQMCNMHWHLRDDPLCLGYGGVAFWNSRADAAREVSRATTQIADGIQQGLVTIPLWHVIKDEDRSAWGLEEVCKFLRASHLPVVVMADAVRAVKNPRAHFGRDVEQMPNPRLVLDLDGNGQPDGWLDCRYAPAGVQPPGGGRAAELGRGASTWVYGPEPGRTQLSFAVRSADDTARTVRPRLRVATIDEKYQYHWHESPCPEVAAGPQWQTYRTSIDVAGDVDRIKIEWEISPPGKVYVGAASWRVAE